LNISLKQLTPIYVLVFLRSLGLSLSVTGPMMALYARSLGISVSEWGRLSTFFALGLISFEALWGNVSDNIDRIRLLTVAMLCMALVIPLYAAKRVVPFFWVLQFLMGSFMVMVGPTTRALIADHSPTNQIGFNMSLWSTCVAVGGILGPLAGGYIASSWGYSMIFYASTLVLLIGVLLLGFTGRWLKEDARPKRGHNYLREIKEVFTVPGILYTFAQALLIFIGVSCIRSFLPIYISEYFALDEVAVGALITVGSGVQLVATPIVGSLSDRLGAEKVLIMILGISCTLFLLMPLAVTPIHVKLLTIGLITSNVSQSVSLIMASKVAPRNKLGATMGIYGSFEDLGLIIGPLLFGFIWEAWGVSYIYVVSSASCFIACLLLLRNIKGLQ